MERRIRDLESSLFVENRKMSDTMKSMRQSERRIKELTFSADEDRKNQEQMQVNSNNSLVSEPIIIIFRKLSWLHVKDLLKRAWTNFYIFPLESCWAASAQDDYVQKAGGRSGRNCSSQSGKVSTGSGKHVRRPGKGWLEWTGSG